MVFKKKEEKKPEPPKIQLKHNEYQCQACTIVNYFDDRIESAECKMCGTQDKITYEAIVTRNRLNQGRKTSSQIYEE